MKPLKIYGNHLKEFFARNHEQKPCNFTSSSITTKKQDKTIVEHFNKMKTIGDNLRSAGGSLIDEESMTQILAGVGNDYDAIVVNLIARIKILTLQEVFSMLLTHESRFDQLLVASNITGPNNPSANSAQNNNKRNQQNIGRNFNNNWANQIRGRYRGARGRGRNNDGKGYNNSDKGNPQTLLPSIWQEWS